MRALLTAVAPVVARAARRVLGRANPDAEDVAQQSLAAFVEGLQTYRAESTVKHFAERIAVYRALTARRDAQVQQRHLTPALALDELVADIVPAHDVALAGRHRRELLLEALETLSSVQAEALALHFLFDHTIGEIAGMMGTPEETVRSRLRLGKQSLRARIMGDPRLAALREELS
jgi:RNA polymerase sigma-70 factor (ECF subfamily)